MIDVDAVSYLNRTTVPVICRVKHRQPAANIRHRQAAGELKSAGAPVRVTKTGKKNS